MVKKVLIGLLVVIIIAAIAGGGSTEPTLVDSNDQDDASNTETTLSDEKFKIGESIKLGDYIVTVNGIENPYIESNDFIKPEAGNKFTAVDVTYENISGDEISYNMFDWTLYDSESYNYDSFTIASKEPSLSSNPAK